MALRAALACALVLVAGCAAPLPVGDQSAGPPPLPEADVHPGLTARLTIYTLQPVHVTVTELGPRGRGVVVDRTYTDEARIEYGDGVVFREDGDYRVVVRVDGVVRWNRTVAHYEAYELRVEPNGSVVVQWHTMA